MAGCREKMELEGFRKLLPMHLPCLNRKLFIAVRQHWLSDIALSVKITCMYNYVIKYIITGLAQKVHVVLIILRKPLCPFGVESIN